jgi:hypothetical protein
MNNKRKIKKNIYVYLKKKKKKRNDDGSLLFCGECPEFPSEFAASSSMEGLSLEI